MKCLSCGNEIIPGQSSCPVCGAVVNNSQSIGQVGVVPNPYSNTLDSQNAGQTYPYNPAGYQNVGQVNMDNMGSYQNVEQSNVNSYNNAVDYQNIQQVDVNSAALEQNGPKIMLTAISNDNGEDAILIDSYISKNIPKLKACSFSIWSMLLGIVYFSYRKMWILSIVWLVVFAISSFNFSVFTTFIVMFVLNLILAINFEKLYMKNVSKQIMKIKTKNVSKTKEEISDIVIKKGGVSIIFALASLVIATLTFYYIYTNGSTAYQTEKLTVKVPNKFSIVDSTNTNKKFILDNSAANLCALSVNVQDSESDDATLYLESIIPRSEGTTVSAVDIKNINDKNWSIITATTSYGKSYYYATTRGGKVYSVVFDTYLENEDCNKAYDVIYDSLKLKVE